MLTTKSITGYIVLKSGLHIGGNKDTMQIGGIDSPVIKNPLTNLPYIPGSSLKGKLRFLLEHYFDLVGKEGKIPGLYSTGNQKWNINKIAVIFGHLEHKEDRPTKPTRVVFSDSNIVGMIDKEDKIIHAASIDDSMIFSEAKTEVVINRITGTALGGGLRTIERVPAGVVFDLNIILKQYDEVQDKDNLSIILKGLKLMSNDALGGSGSRGSGRIEFRNLQVNGEDIDLDTITL